MVIFHSYVSLPEGKTCGFILNLPIFRNITYKCLDVSKINGGFHIWAIVFVVWPHTPFEFVWKLDTLKCSHFFRKCPRKHVMFGTLGVCNVFGQSLYHHMFAIYPLWNGRLYTPILAKLITSPSFVIQNEYVLIGYLNQSPILFHCILQTCWLQQVTNVFHY